MSPALDPMSFDELSELYRVEMKSSAITQVRRDLFRAMANLLVSLRHEYDRQMALDPESVMCEGADQRRKKAERLVKDVIHIRTQKICQMAIRGAMGGRNTLDALTDEEKDYYEKVQDLSKRHMAETDRLRGRRNTVDTHIDEIPSAHVRTQEPEPEPAAEPAPVAEPEQVPQEVFDDSPEDFQEEPISDEFDGFMEDTFDEPDQAPLKEPAQVAKPAPILESKPVKEQSPETHDLPEVNRDELKPVLIRVLEDLPEFAGPDRDYKLFKEDLVTMPKVLAEVLVNTEKAVAIRPTP